MWPVRFARDPAVQKQHDLRIKLQADEIGPVIRTATTERQRLGLQHGHG